MGGVVCMMFLVACGAFIIDPAVQAGPGRTPDFWHTQIPRILLAGGVLMGAASALLLQLYRVPEKGEAQWKPLLWGSVMAVILGAILLIASYVLN